MKKIIYLFTVLFLVLLIIGCDLAKEGSFTMTGKWDNINNGYDYYFYNNSKIEVTFSFYNTPVLGSSGNITEYIGAYAGGFHSAPQTESQKTFSYSPANKVSVDTSKIGEVIFIKK